MFTKLIYLTGFFALALGQMAPHCYTGGLNPATMCDQFIDDFCTKVDPEPLRLHDTNHRCFNLPTGNRCDLLVYNSYQANVSPSGVNCSTVLRNVTRNCRYGGRGQINANAYTFTIDSNVGQCDNDA